MEPAETVSATDGTSATAGAAIPICPECGAPCSVIGVRATSLIGGDSLYRCQSCGTRFCWASGVARRVVTCRRCCLPIEIAGSENMPNRICGECVGAPDRIELPDEALVRATDAELRAALESRLQFVDHSSLQPYLSRLMRSLCSSLENVPEDSEVVVFDESAQRILTLPTGTLLLSTATLAGIRDEAELAFLLARELLHLDRGEVADRTVRVGLAAAAGHAAQWTEVAGDLMRLGYGSEREYAVDTAAVELMASHGYEPEAALRYLRRQAARVEAGDPVVSELAQAGPPFAKRLSRLAMRVRGSAVPGEERSNREPFRRVAGEAVLSANMKPLSGPVLIRETGDVSMPLWRRAWVWAAAAVLLALAAVAIARELLFRR